MSGPDRREFVTYRRGQVRDEIILTHFRNALRTINNPATGRAFTEDEIARSTSPGTRRYVEADALDVVLKTTQQRAMTLADQMDPRRANSRMLETFHARMWVGGGKLPAYPSSGDVQASGVAGTSCVGSLSLGDASALVGVDGNGVEYQLLATEALSAEGSARLTLKALAGGAGTNIPIGTEITWTVNKPAGLAAKAAVVEQVGYSGRGFSGGYDGESDADLVTRIGDAYADRAGGGNAAQFQQWALEASSAVEQAFVYPCALHAGSVIVSPTQRRDRSILAGPSGRLPTAAMISDLTAQLVPPASPVVPEGAFVLVVAPASQDVDLVLRIAMTQGAGAGWFNAIPWPNPAIAAPVTDTPAVAITSVVSVTEVLVSTTATLPGGATQLTDTAAPALMVWVQSASRFERLDVASVTSLGSSSYRVVLNSAPDHVLAIGNRISPYTDRAEEIAVALEQYFDLLGPGEVVASSDPRWARAARRPFPSVRYPAKIGTTLETSVADMLGTAASDVSAPVVSRTVTDLSGDLANGPNMMILGAVSVYAEGSS